jgi:hypothetical protein
VAGGLGAERVGAPGQAAQDPGRGGRLEVPAGADPQPGGEADHGGQLLAAEPRPQAFRGGDHQAEQLPLGIGAGLHGGAAGRQQHRQGLALPGRAGGAQLGPRQRFARGADGIERAGFGAVAPAGALGAVQLQHQLIPPGQQAGQPGAVPAGALDRPGRQPRVHISEVHQGLVTVRGGRYRQLAQHPTGAGIGHRRAMGLHMGIHADDDLDDLRQTSHAFISLPGGT